MALAIPVHVLFGQTPDQPGASPSLDPAKRLEWLNSRVPRRPAPTPKAVVQPKIGFRANPQVVGARPVAIQPSPKPAPPAIASPKPRIAEVRPAKATPPPLAKLMTPKVVVGPTPAKVRLTEARATPVPKPTLAPAVAAIPATKTLSPKPEPPTSIPSTVGGRYPWKTRIVTTVFWVGERPSGNNFTPNHASSWDSHWAKNFGGFDNPDPAARRGYIPARFVPRQNPFYIALPYNDVTRGTTKPEARRVIPWFKDAFRKEGQSVCRDRWVAVRNRAGKVGYAQWSDCGPFRTDHWQYVFGNERPRPNLNKGAGLDVSPALRDFLGLGGTDVTDWKFVDFKDVPSGPWARYGDNNTFAQRGARSGNATAQAADTGPRVRIREL